MQEEDKEQSGKKISGWPVPGILHDSFNFQPQRRNKVEGEDATFAKKKKIRTCNYTGPLW